jgi:hypothetical protein
VAEIVEGPVDPGRTAEIAGVDAAVDDDDVVVIVDAEAADEGFERGDVRGHADHAVTLGAPAGFLVVGVDGTRDMRLGVGLVGTAVDAVPDVENDEAGRIEMRLQPVGVDQRARIVDRRKPGPRGRGAGEDEGGGLAVHGVSGLGG